MPRKENLDIENRSAKIQLKEKARFALKAHVCVNVSRKENEAGGWTVVQESLWHMVRSFYFYFLKAMGTILNK